MQEKIKGTLRLGTTIAFTTSFILTASSCALNKVNLQPKVEDAKKETRTQVQKLPKEDAERNKSAIIRIGEETALGDYVFKLSDITIPYKSNPPKALISIFKKGDDTSLIEKGQSLSIEEGETRTIRILNTNTIVFIHAEKILSSFIPSNSYFEMSVSLYNMTEEEKVKEK